MHLSKSEEFFIDNLVYFYLIVVIFILISTQKLTSLKNASILDSGSNIPWRSETKSPVNFDLK
jgi:hypothetical protein